MDGMPWRPERPLWIESRQASMCLPHLRFIVDHMRERDVTEIFATRSQGPTRSSREALAREVLQSATILFVFGRDQPIAVVGANEGWPGFYSVFAFATDEFPRIALTVTRFVKRTMIPMLINRGARRAQAASHQDHTNAHKWLRIMGAEHEGTLKAFGKDGSDFLMFRWLRPAGS